MEEKTEDKIYESEYETYEESPVEEGLKQEQQEQQPTETEPAYEPELVDKEANYEGNPNVEKDILNFYDFESKLVTPKSEMTFKWMNRDDVLGNIKDEEVIELRSAAELIELLDKIGCDNARDAFIADNKFLLNVSRSREGFQQNMLRTSISHFKGADQVGLNPERRTFFPSFRKKDKKF